MIRGIGIDTVAIDRFKAWLSFSDQQLNRIFTLNEIAYCNQYDIKKPERLASRFAAKEAFYKAYSAALNIRPSTPFLTMCKCIELYNNPHPNLHITDNSLLEQLKICPLQVKIHISITHTQYYATALVLIETI